MSFGAANVIWHSTPGDCRFSFERVYPTGGDADNPTFTLAHPVLPGASARTCLIGIISATNGAQIDGARNVQYTNSLGVSRSADWVFSGGSFPGWSGGGGVWFVGWQGIDPAGGNINFTASSSHLNFTTGTLFRSANGVAIACAVDVGPKGALAYAGLNDVTGDSTTLTAVPINHQATGATTFDFLADPLQRGVMLGLIADYGGASLTPTGTPWSLVVTDSQTITQGGGDGLQWPPTAVAISVCDTDTANFQEAWTLGASEAFKVSGAVVWLPPGATGRNSVQGIG